MTRTIVTILCFQTFFTLSHCAAKLNVPKVLLPFHTGPYTHFTLAASDGCYAWESSRPDVAKVEAVTSGGDPASCSSHALVTTISAQASEATSIVIARERATGAVLRCDVIVNRIASISILTTTRHLYLEDAPEVFDLLAYDEEGNAFSSLDGIEFVWSLLPDGRAPAEGRSTQDPSKVLRFIRFADSDYDTQKHIHDMELRSAHGSSCLVEGIKTGTAVVQAKLKDPRYSDVAPVSATLVVVANLVLDPSVDSYILVNGVIPYKVKQIRQNSIEDIVMPNSQYFLSVVDDAICGLEESSSLISGLAKGLTQVVLQDRDVAPKSALSINQPTARVYVVDPHHLGFLIEPDQNWVLESGRRYNVTIQIFDSDNHLIYASPNIKIKALFPEQYFRVVSSTPNGVTYEVEALQHGMDYIRATLNEIIPLGSSSPLPIEPSITGEQEFEIFSPIVLTPEILVFPWLPFEADEAVTYRYELKASGGSGHYLWKTSSSEVGVVDSHGTLTTRSTGSTTVSAIDVRNKDHFAVARVYVLPPNELKFLPSAVEVQIGGVLALPLQLTVKLPIADEVVAVTDCRGLPFVITSTDNTIFEYAPELEADEAMPGVDGACQGIHVKAAGSQGFAQIGASLTATKDITLTAETTVGAFKPLQPVFPIPYGLVTLGSSLEVAFSGGPQAWVKDPAHYFQLPGSAESDSFILGSVEKMKKTIPKGVMILHVFRVTCRVLTESTVSLRVGNEASTSNPFPAAAVAEMPFVCAVPVGLQIRPNVLKPSSLPIPCPLHADDSSAIPVSSAGVLGLLVSVSDAQGRGFHNFSSLDFQWTISDTTLAALSDPPTLKLIATPDAKSKRSSAVGLELSGNVGEVKVSATVASYLENHLVIVAPETEPEVTPPITDDVTLQLVGAPKMVPEALTLFNHPTNKATIEILGGSGYFHVTSSDSTLAEIEYDVSRPREVVTTPSLDGDLIIEAFDLCVDGSASANTQIHIAGLHSIDLNVLDKVELGHAIVASVVVLDTRGIPLPSHLHSIIGLKPVLHDGGEFVSLSPDITLESDGVTAKYVVKGIAIGHTSLAFTASESRSDSLISSLTKPIQVFPPLQLSPKNITLIIGAEFQVLAFGGPQPESTVEYSIDDSSISSVSSNGLITALALGDTRVVGKAVGLDAVTGEKIVYSQDEVNVFVVRLLGLRIHAPLRRLKVGNTMPLYAVGVTSEAETPHAFGSADPALTFTWSINSKQIASLHAPIHERHIVFPSFGDFARRVKALEPGHVKVSLTVTVSESSVNQVEGNQILEDSIEIQIFADLALVSPPKPDASILITPNTEMAVKTSRDGAAAAMSYKITNACGQNAVATVSSDGLLRSGASLGTATLQVTAHEGFGANQTMAVLVRVAPIAYVMLNSATVVQSSSVLNAIPVGLGLDLSTSYHDSVGDVFDAVDAVLQKRPNRFDLLEISASANQTLTARANRVGLSVLKIWVQSKSSAPVADYIGVVVGNVIAPSSGIDGLVVGDVLCFASPLLTASSDVGHWSLGTGGSAGALKLYSSGLAVAVKPGVESLHYIIGSNQYTLIDARVSAHGGVALVPAASDAAPLSVGGGADSIAVDVVFKGGDGTASSNLRSALTPSCKAELAHVAFPTLLSCALSFAGDSHGVKADELFSVSPTFDDDSGSHRCVVKMKAISDDSALLEAVSKIDAAVVLSVSSGVDGVSDSVPIPFVAPFFVVSPAAASDPLVASSGADATVLVSASSATEAALDVSAGRPELVAIGKDFGKDEVLKISISVLDGADSGEDAITEITILNTLTGQKSSVSVLIKSPAVPPSACPVVPPPPSPNPGFLMLIVSFLLAYYQSIIIIILTSLATLGAVYVAYIILLRRPSPTLPPAFLAGPPLTPSPRKLGGGDATSPAPIYAWRSPSGGRSAPQLWSTNGGSPTQQQNGNRSFRLSPS